ncbi:MAG: ABC transporter substrate-binding protein [Proteobacteria bacterium]|nr:ABC transporter substrate-binding protein [Pseudomonadota bacterium]
MIRVAAFAGFCVLLCACSKPAPEESGTGRIERVVTFAPHLAEMMYLIGAEQQLVGVSARSDFPRQVLKLPQVGDAFTIDQEQLTLLEPDLVLVWESGMPAHTIDELRGRGYRVESIRTRNVADVAAAIVTLGDLTGHERRAAEAAAAFTGALGELRSDYGDAEPIDVFFQVSTRPLYTVNREHFISEIIEICGGRNVFEDAGGFAPSVSVEAVVDRDPEAMLAGTDLGDDAFSEWLRWPGMAAVRYGNQFLLSDETIGRPSPRLAAAAGSVCIALDRARANRGQSPD